MRRWRRRMPAAGEGHQHRADADDERGRRPKARWQRQAHERLHAFVTRHLADARRPFPCDRLFRAHGVLLLWGTVEPSSEKQMKCPGCRKTATPANVWTRRRLGAATEPSDS